MTNETYENDREYAVEKIVKKRVNSNNDESFKIRWLGYSKHDDWWMSEKHCLPACCDLVEKYELSHFVSKRRKKLKPEVIGFKKVDDKLKLLIRWLKTEKLQFYYSSVIQKVYPEFLLNFYEKKITPVRQLDEEWTHFINTRVRNMKLFDNDKPSNIIAVARCAEEELCLVQLEQNEVPVILELRFIKERYPELLIEFYERHLIPKND